MDNSLAVRDPCLWQHDNVLKSLLEIHDEAQLRKAELVFSVARLVTLGLGPWNIGLPCLRYISSYPVSGYLQLGRRAMHHRHLA